MDKELRQFIEDTQADVQSLVYSDGEGATFEDKFTEYCIGKLEDIGETEGARVCYYNYPGEPGKDWKVNGYCLRDLTKNEKTSSFETLDLFIAHYQSYPEHTITKDAFQKSINQIKRFLNNSLKGHIDYVDPSHEIFGLIKIIKSQSGEFDRINLFFLINGFCNHSVEKIALKGYEDLGIYVHVWDIQRLFRVSQSSSMREPLEINLSDLVGGSAPGIQCLKIPDLHELYECYLAIVPGKVLAELYREHSSKLLESNVRAFLGQTGKYNKGIQNTIREKPEMFLPYNNGLSATAESVATVSESSQLYITRVNDFQIVNGGQTTASIYHTHKKYKDADLSKIFVQMKLTVVKDNVQKNSEVPNIARYANSQNKVTELDLSSNNVFFIRIEELSRRKYVRNPENAGQQILWFFERVNGQYREALSKLTVANQRIFKEKNPPSFKFSKSDVAKQINLWEQEPHQVSFGAQKNFIHFMKKVMKTVEKERLPGENFYKKLIANSILYRITDGMFGRKGVNAIGDTNVKSYAVAYTLSYFHYLTDNRLDLWKIYELQIVDNKVRDALQSLLQLVYNFLSQGAKSMLLSEYAKKESTWQALRNEHYSIDIESLSGSLIAPTLVIERELEKEIDTEKVENELMTISRINELGIKFWDGLKLTIEETSLFKDIEFAIWDLLTAMNSGRSFSADSFRAGKRVLEAIDSGELNPEVISSRSALEDKGIVDVKGIYDRMRLLSRDDWARIIDLSAQRKIFTYLELANVKSIYRAISKNEKINPASITQADISIKKLKKYGIKY